MQLTTTLKKIEELQPSDRFKRKLGKALGKGFDPEVEFNLLKLLPSIGPMDTLWAMGAAIQGDLAGATAQYWVARGVIESAICGYEKEIGEQRWCDTKLLHYIVSLIYALKSNLNDDMSLSEMERFWGSFKSPPQIDTPELKLLMAGIKNLSRSLLWLHGAGSNSILAPMKTSRAVEIVYRDYPSGITKAEFVEIIQKALKE